ncbi:MAG TPA: BlaI/MecI/CopY family transcriptional regulator, partial [Candidatus Acidoferrales bacterium]|nr:BlaI/MecI/CopY family transcriptional regulator [Candidatus Acidoferrales bacterium]
YEARAPKEQTQRQIAGDLLKRAFEGSAKSLVLGALAAQPASGKDLAEIRSLLDEFEKTRERTDHATEPAVDRASGLDASAFSGGREFWWQPSRR